jgi:hypothetical protein
MRLHTQDDRSMFMTQAREEQNMAGNGRRAWTSPSVRRMSAGSAEDANGPTPDAGQPS